MFGLRGLKSRLFGIAGIVGAVPYQAAHELPHIPDDDEGRQASPQTLAAPFIHFIPLAVIDMDGNKSGPRAYRRRYPIAHGAGRVDGALHSHTKGAKRRGFDPQIFMACVWYDGDEHSLFSHVKPLRGNVSPCSVPLHCAQDVRSCQTFLKKKFESYQSIRTQKSGGTAPPIGWGKKAQVDIIYINGPKKRPRSAPIFSAKKPLEQNKTKQNKTNGSF